MGRKVDEVGAAREKVHPGSRRPNFKKNKYFSCL